MKVATIKTINENIITVEIKAEDLGTSTSDAEELDMVHDFPKYIEYRDIDFSGNMKIGEGGVPMVTADEVAGGSVEKVSITGLANKKYPVDETLDIIFTLDITKIPASDLTTVFNSRALLGQAKAVLFETKVKEEISKKLEEMRAENNSFEGETETVL